MSRDAGGGAASSARTRERNRKRLLEAAQTLFRERGLDVSVAEIAEAAGVGRGTLFRNFASKEDLIEAIVAERMHEAAACGEQLLEADDPGDALFEFLGADARAPAARSGAVRGARRDAGWPRR